MKQKKNTQPRGDRAPVTPAPVQRSVDRNLIAAFLIFAVALIVRTVFLRQILSVPYFDNPIIDPKQYDDLARILLQGSLIPFKALYQAPFYSYFLCAVYRLFGTEHVWPHIVTAVMGAGNIFLVYALGRRLFSRSVGLIGAAVTAVYGTFIFYEGDFYRENLLVTLMLLLGLLALRAAGLPRRDTEERYSPRLVVKWLALGIVFAVSVVTRENVLILLPLLVFLVYAFLPRLKNGQKAVLVLCLLLPLALSLYRLAQLNHEAEGKWSFTSSQGGLNFYIGNNPDMDTTTTLQPGIDWEKLTALPLMKAGIFNSEEASRWFYRAAAHFIVGQPVAWAKIMVKKLYLFWSGYEMMPNEDLELYRRASPVLRFLVWHTRYFHFPFGLIAPLALAGLYLAAREKRPEHLLFIALIGLYMVSVVVFHVRARYRLPVVPFLILFASYALTRLPALRRESRDGFRRALALCGGFFVVLNFPLYDFSYAERYPSNYNIAKIHADLKDYPAAEKLYLQAIEDNRSNLAETWNDLAVLYMDTGRDDRAIPALQKSISLVPDFDRMHLTLGKTYGRRGQFALAFKEMEQAYRLNPYNPENVVTVAELLEKPRPEASRKLYHQVLELSRRLPFVDPELLRRARNGLWHLGEVNIDDNQVMTDKMKRAVLKQQIEKGEDVLRKADLSSREGRIQASDAWNNIGVAYLRMGNAGEAKNCFEKSLAISYRQTPAHINIAIACKKLGLMDEAVKHYRFVLQMQPDNYLALNNLGAIFRDRKDYAQALSYFRKALALAPDNPTIQRNIVQVRQKMKEGK